MGGSKNKSPAQKERAQKRNTDQKTKSEKGDKSTKIKIAVVINESEAIKYINAAKMITAYELSRETNTKRTRGTKTKRTRGKKVNGRI